MRIWDNEEKKLFGKSLVSWLSCALATFVIFLIIVLFLYLLTICEEQNYKQKHANNKLVTTVIRNSRAKRSISEEHRVTTLNPHLPIKKKLQTIIGTYSVATGVSDEDNKYPSEHIKEFEILVMNETFVENSTRFITLPKDDSHYDTTDYDNDNNYAGRLKETKMGNKEIIRTPEYILNNDKHENGRRVKRI